HFLSFSLLLPPPPTYTLFPYTTLFRSLQKAGQLPFDRLLIATGSQPAKLPIPGADLAGVHPCWTLADARRIAQRAVRSARVLQIDRKSTRLNSSHLVISYAVFCLKKKT